MEQTSKVKEFFASNMGRITITAVSAVIIYGIIIAALASSNTVIFLIAFFGCTYFGWTAINNIIRKIINITLIMGLSKWLIYIAIKGIISACIGAFVAPFQIGKLISNKLSAYCSEK